MNPGNTLARKLNYNLHDDVVLAIRYNIHPKLRNSVVKKISINSVDFIKYSILEDPQDRYIGAYSK